MLISVLFASGAVLFARYAAITTHWTTVGAFRALVAAAIAFFACKLRRKRLIVQNAKWIWARSLAGTSAMALYFYSIGSEVHIGDISTLRATVPLFVALFSGLILGERVHSYFWYVMIPVGLGIILVVKPEFTTATGVSCIVLCSACFSAIAMISIRKLYDESPDAVALHFGLVSAFFLTIASFGQPPISSMVQMIPLVGTGVFGGLSQLALTRALYRAPAAQIMSIDYLQVPSVYLGSIVFFERQLTLQQAIGAGLIISGGLWLQHSLRNRADR